MPSVRPWYGALICQLALIGVAYAQDEPATPPAAVEPAVAAATWQAEINEFGLRTATVAGVATLGAKQVPAILRLQCRPGGGGSTTWELEVADASTLTPFSFDAYEGPDATAANQRLTEIRPEGGLLRVNVKAAVAGYYGVNPDSFIFSLAAPVEATSDGALLADSISALTTTLTWTTRDAGDTNRMIAASFPMTGAAPLIARTMLGCGPTPPLTEATLSAWLGRNPGATDLWRNKGVVWRLQGLLGRDYDAVMQRVGNAQPVGREGDVYFVLAPDADAARSGVALMFALNADTTAILIDDGEVKRLESHEGAIVPPAAVREFVAARVGATD